MDILRENKKKKKKKKKQFLELLVLQRKIWSKIQIHQRRE
jgi:hypothetical protein